MKKQRILILATFLIGLCLAGIFMLLFLRDGPFSKGETSALVGLVLNIIAMGLFVLAHLKRA